MDKAFGTPRQPVLNSQPRLADLTTKAKTPFQSNNAYQRGFKSELRVPMQPAATIGCHTGHRQLKTVGKPPRGDSITARLKNFISNKELPPTVAATAATARTPAANTAHHHLHHHHQQQQQQQQQQQYQQHSQHHQAVREPARTLCHTIGRTQHQHHTEHQQQAHQQAHQHQISRTQSEPNITYQVHVNDRTYKILRKIGAGGSSKVYEGFDPRSSQTVAIKIINVGQADPRARESYFNEKDLLLRLRDSPYVVDMYECEYKSNLNELIIVMEKGDADLAQVIDSHFKKRDPRQVDGIFIKFYWRGILQAVNSIHQHGIVHADLKPVNFILVRNEIKLIDFGIANAIAPEGTSVIRDYQIGTINFMPPEALKNRAAELSFTGTNHNNNHPHLSSGAPIGGGCDENNPPTQHRKTVIKYNSKADIWSLGCILYNLVYGRPPFDKYKDMHSKTLAITDPNHRIEFPLISNPRLLNCLKACLRYNPAERPSAQELLNDPYLKEDVVVVLQNAASSQQRELRLT